MPYRRTLATPVLLAPILAITVLLSGCGRGTEQLTAAPDPASTAATEPPPAAAGSAGGSGTTPTPSPSESSGSVSKVSQATRTRSAGPPGWRLCVNRRDGYAIRYPAGWFTTHLKKDPPCQMFDPERFEIPWGSEYPHTDLEVRRIQSSMPQRVQEITEPDGEWKVLSGGYVTIRGRRAFRFEMITKHGELEFDKGTRWYGYVLDHRTALVVSTLGFPGERGYGAHKGAVDEAVRSLTLF